MAVVKSKQKLEMPRIRGNSLIRIIELTLLMTFIILAVITLFSEKRMSTELRPPGFDEIFWTNNAIVSYNIFFRGLVLDNIKDDSWFTSFAKREGLNIFKGQSNQIDYRKIPKEKYQWFDFKMWTFGWKAPNFSKLSKGIYIYLTEDASQIKPEGYSKPGLKEYGRDPRLYFPQFLPVSYVERARQLDAFFCLCTLIILFLSGWMFFEYWVGLVAAFIVLSNKNFVNVCTSSGMDSSALLFTSMSIFFLLWGIRSFQKGAKLKTLFLQSIGLGLSMGLAVSSKYNSALVFFIVAAILPMLLLTVYRNYTKISSKNISSKKKARSKAQSKARQYIQQSSIRLGVITVVTSILSIGSFLYLNPHMKGDTLSKVSIIRQSVDSFFEKRALSKGTMKIKESWTKSFDLVLKKNYWRTDTIKAYRGTFGSLLPFKHNFMDLAFLLIGLFISIWTSTKIFLQKNIVSPHLILVISFLIIFYFNVDFIWIDFARYHTPFWIAGSLIMGVGIIELVKKILSNILTTSLEEAQQ